jgi:hypothetical protein
METSERVFSDATERGDVPLMRNTRPLRTWAGHGSGATCSGCGQSIRPQEIEYEIELPASGAERPQRYQPGSDGKSLRFHFACYRNWTRR